MNRENGKNEIILAIIAIAVSMGIYSFCGRVLLTGIEDSFMFSLCKQITFAIPVTVFVILYRKIRIFRPNPKMLRSGWSSGLVLLIIIIMNAFRCLGAPIDTDGITFLCFVLQVFLIGYCEETLFRGLLLNAFHKAFGLRSLAGARLAVVLSGIIFGLMHILNATNPNVSFLSALSQAGTAAFLGMFLGAVYIRVGKGLWYLVFLHAVNDGVAYIASGRMGGVSDAEIIEMIGQQAGYLQVLIMGALFGLVTIFLLRKKKLQYCLDKLNH